ncbi:hypothetical protein [Caulobacter sp. Root343]|uniref:hypothetical protein n=1 Tax=Caulobacter sp. Root343 TaxID=1736520 RepID=UPI0006F7AD44|nr:hypothetical protein [Caulobacter sp. Root343]KQV66591.1 hypothetical protein ASC70_12215 [Caulobacter sp. Root343]
MNAETIIRLTGISLDDKMRLLGAERVKIHSDNGWWRSDRAGYTDQANAAIYSGADAYEATGHCGPEKHVAYYIQPKQDPVTTPAQVLVPVEPPVELLVSMAIRQDHGLGVPGYYDQPIFGGENIGHEARMRSAIGDMRKLYEEVVGAGFYSPEHAERYRALAPSDDGGVG